MQPVWLETFGLQRNPFADTLDTDFFFSTKQHEAAALKIRIAMHDKHALILLSGPSGIGKTLVSQVVVRELDHALFEPVFVFVYPGMGKGALLEAISAELGLPKGRFVHDRLRLLQEKALELYAHGRRLVIFIDEAHFLKADALHILRTLSNLETEHEKLVTVLLIAEETLNRRLKANTYASLRSRITFAINLMPLSREDLEQYVKYRLLKGGAAPNLVDRDVYDELFRLSGGIPREINRLMYTTFIETIAQGRARVTAELVGEVV